MASKIELLQEAYNRGILPESKMPLYDEAIRRGLIQQGQKTNESDSLGAFVRGVGQGASFGFGEEIGAALGALPATAVSQMRGLFDSEYEPKGYSEMYSDILQRERGELSQLQEENPLAYAGGEIAGAIGTGIGGATTKGGAALARSVSSGGLPARIAKGSIVGAASGGLYGYGTGEGEGRMESAQRGAQFGAAGGAAAPIVGSGLKAAKGALIPIVDEQTKALARRAKSFDIPLRADQVAPTKARRTIQKVSQELPLSGSDAFENSQRIAFNRAVAKTIGQESDTLSPETINNFLSKTNENYAKALGKKKTYQLSDDLTGKLASVAKEASELTSSDITSVVRKNIESVLNDIGDGALTGEKISSIRSALVKKASKATPEARPFLSDIVNAIDDALEPSLNKAQKALLEKTRREYRNFKTIEPLLEKSTDGMINPAQLQQRVAASPYIKASRQALGEDDLVDLARIGKQFLPKQGGSDTFQKAAFGAGGAGIIGTTLANPALGAAIATKAAAGIGANRALQKGVLQNQRLINRAIAEGAESLPSGAGRVSGGVGGASLGLEGNGAKFMDTTGVKTRIDVKPTTTSIDELGGSSGNDTLQNNPYGANWQPSPRMLLGEAEYDGGFNPTYQAPAPELKSDSSFFERLIMAESSGNPNAKAKTSSASGLAQFTDGTFRSILKKYGKGTGYTMKDKNKPEVQMWALEQLTNENKRALTKSLGREPNNGELYLAHFAGISGAKRLLKADAKNPRIPAIRVTSPDAVKANESIYYKGKYKNGKFIKERPRTVSEVIELLSRKVS